MQTTELIEVAHKLGITPEEIETLLLDDVCPRCDHRYLFHDTESGFCVVEGCHCRI